MDNTKTILEKTCKDYDFKSFNDFWGVIMDGGMNDKFLKSFMIQFAVEVSLQTKRNLRKFIDESIESGLEPKDIPTIISDDMLGIPEQKI